MGMVERKMKFAAVKVSWCQVKNMDDIPIQIIFTSDFGEVLSVDMSYDDVQIVIDALKDVKDAIDKINE